MFIYVIGVERQRIRKVWRGGVSEMRVIGDNRARSASGEYVRSNSRYRRSLRTLARRLLAWTPHSPEPKT